MTSTWIFIIIIYQATFMPLLISDWVQWIWNNTLRIYCIPKWFLYQYMRLYRITINNNKCTYTTRVLEKIFIPVSNFYMRVCSIKIYVFRLIINFIQFIMNKKWSFLFLSRYLSVYFVMMTLFITNCYRFTRQDRSNWTR